MKAGAPLYSLLCPVACAVGERWTLVPPRQMLEKIHWPWGQHSESDPRGWPRPRRPVPGC